MAFSEAKDYLDKNGYDDRFQFYNVINSVKILGCELDGENCEVSISKDLEWEEVEQLSMII